MFGKSVMTLRGAQARNHGHRCENRGQTHGVLGKWKTVGQENTAEQIRVQNSGDDKEHHGCSMELCFQSFLCRFEGIGGPEGPQYFTD